MRFIKSFMPDREMVRFLGWILLFGGPFLGCLLVDRMWRDTFLEKGLLKYADMLHEDSAEGREFFYMLGLGSELFWIIVILMGAWFSFIGYALLRLVPRASAEVR